jgi:hypothetical protein
MAVWMDFDGLQTSIASAMLTFYGSCSGLRLTGIVN